MMYAQNPSLEEMPADFAGHAQLPVICDRCHYALHRERGGWGDPRSYAAMATSAYHYHVVDWRGLSTTSCHCCNARHYGERHAVRLVRRH